MRTLELQKISTNALARVERAIAGRARQRAARVAQRRARLADQVGAVALFECAGAHVVATLVRFFCWRRQSLCVYLLQM